MAPMRIDVPMGKHRGQRSPQSDLMIKINPVEESFDIPVAVMVAAFKHFEKLIGCIERGSFGMKCDTKIRCCTKGSLNIVGVMNVVMYLVLANDLRPLSPPFINQGVVTYTRLGVRQTMSSRNRLSSLNILACSSRSAQLLSRLPPNLGPRRLRLGTSALRASIHRLSGSEHKPKFRSECFLQV